MPADLTRPQVNALAQALRNGGVSVIGKPSINSRVRCRLAAAGLIERDGPSAITRAGLEALRVYRTNRYARHGCVAYLSDLKEVEAAIAEAAAQ